MDIRECPIAMGRQAHNKLMDIDDVPSLFSNNKDKKVLEQIQKFLEKK